MICHTPHQCHSSSHYYFIENSLLLLYIIHTYIPSYTLLYPLIPSYTLLYPLIPSYTLLYPLIPPFFHSQVERLNVLLPDSFLSTATVVGGSISSTKQALLSPYTTQHVLLFLKSWGEAYLMPSMGIYAVHSPRLWDVLGENSLGAAVMLETILTVVQNVLLYWGEEEELCVVACDVLQALTSNPRIRKNIVKSQILPSFLSVFKIAAFSHNSMMTVIPQVLTPQELPASLATVLTTWQARSNNISLSTLSTLMRLQNPTLHAFAASIAACIQEDMLPNCPVAQCLYSVIRYRVELLSKHPAFTKPTISNSYEDRDESLFIEQAVTTMYLLRGACAACNINAVTVSSLFSCYAPLLIFFTAVSEKYRGKYITYDYILLQVFLDILEHHLGYYNNVQIVFIYSLLNQFLTSIASPAHQHILANTAEIDGGLVIDNVPVEETDLDEDAATSTITGVMILTRILVILRQATSRLLVPVLDPIPQAYLASLSPAITERVTAADMLLITPISPDSIRMEIKTDAMKNVLMSVFATIVPFVSPVIQQDYNLSEAYYTCLSMYLKTCCLLIFAPDNTAAASSLSSVVLGSVNSGLSSVYDGIVKITYGCIDVIAKRHVDMCRQLLYIAQGNRVKGQNTKSVAVMVNTAVQQLQQAGKGDSHDGSGIYLGAQETIGLISVNNTPYFSLLKQQLLVECCPMSSQLSLLQADVDQWLSALPLTSVLSSLFSLVLSRILFSNVNANLLYGEAADALYTLLTCLVAFDDITITLATTQRKCQQQLLELLSKLQQNISLPFQLVLPQNNMAVVQGTLQQQVLTTAQRHAQENVLLGHQRVSELIGSTLQQQASGTTMSPVILNRLEQLLQQLLKSAEENKPSDCFFGYSINCDNKNRRGQFKSSIKTLVGQVRAAMQSK